MNDIRRFFRYVIPGLIFTLQIVIYLCISLSPSQLSQVIDKLSNVGAVLSIFLLSGGLGFLLSTFYHTLYWVRCKWMNRLRVNHRPLIETAIGRGWLRVYNHNLTPVEEIKNPKAAWRIATSFWHTHKRETDIIKVAESRIDTLGSTMHGIGTSLVGTVLSYLAWLSIHWKFYYLTCESVIIVSVLAFIFFVILFSNFLMIKRDYQSVFEIISNEQLKADFSAGRISTLHLDEDVNDVFFKRSKKGRKANSGT